MSKDIDHSSGREGIPEGSLLLLEKDENPETEVPVPERPISKTRLQYLVYRLRLSQKIGILLHLNRIGELSPGGKVRLLYLQEKASFEAISAGLRFAQRLEAESKLQSDFRKHGVELNRRPQSRRFRVREASRIGIGYRDKGTLPENSASPRRKADESCWVYLQDLPEEIGQLLSIAYSEGVEGDWFDLSILATSEKMEMRLEGKTSLLNLV